MSPPLSRHWLHPQTVPRGFLRLYILNLLSHGPESGYSIMQGIEDRTEGAWRPGAGTMYPLLKSLSREGLVREAGPDRKVGRREYSLTRAGVRELDEIRETLAKLGQKERVMGRLLSDILPGDVYVSMATRRLREGSETLRRKIAEIPRPERDAQLRELRFLLENQIQWVDSQLTAVRPRGSRLQR